MPHITFSHFVIIIILTLSLGMAFELWWITLRVMDGSPEKSLLIFEIAKFVAGRISLASLRKSSSVSLNSFILSTFWYMELEKKETPKHKRPIWDITEKMLQTWTTIWELGISVELQNEKQWKIKSRWTLAYYLKVTPLVKQEDKKHKHPNPNHRLDFATSLHITKSVIISPIRPRLHFS